MHDMMFEEMNPVDPDAETSSDDLRWLGWLPRFSGVREGGPGKPISLSMCLLAVIGMGAWGLRTMDRDGIDSGGPALVLVAATLLAAMFFWFLIKAVLRPLGVTFSVTEKGIEAIPTKQQQDLDRGMRLISLVIFWFTYKGGQWSRWHPVIRWKEVRSVAFDDDKEELLVRGGVWDIRLTGAGDRYGKLCQTVHALAPKGTRFTHRWRTCESKVE